MVHKKGEVNSDMKTKGRIKKKKEKKKKTKSLKRYRYSIIYTHYTINTKKSNLHSLKEIACFA
jgi:hypothetical protein